MKTSTPGNAKFKKKLDCKNECAQNCLYEIRTVSSRCIVSINLIYY